jgi:hypothetical protein
LNKVVAGILERDGFSLTRHDDFEIETGCGFLFPEPSFPLLYFDWISKLGGYFYRWDFPARLSFWDGLSFVDLPLKDRRFGPGSFMMRGRRVGV